MTDLLTLTAEVAAGYLSNTKVPPEDLPAIIRAIHAALDNAERGADSQPEAPQLTSAQIRKSITPEALISFEDGRPYRMLRRHLTTRGLTPAGYRAKWGLPEDYPMVAPAYSERRSVMAKAAGLGQKTRRGLAQGAETLVETVKDAASEVLGESSAPAAPQPEKRGRGRPRKAAA